MRTRRHLHTRLGGGLLATALVVTALATSTAAYAVSWDNVTPYVDSGKSTADLQKLVYTPVAGSTMSAIDAAYANGALSADGTPGLAQVYAHTDHTMYYKSDAKCAGPKSAIAAADSQYTLAAWCFDGTEETSDRWLPQAVTTSQDAEQQSGYSAGGDEVVALWRQEALSDNRAHCPGVPEDTDSSMGLRATTRWSPRSTATART